MSLTWFRADRARWCFGAACLAAFLILLAAGCSTSSKDTAQAEAAAKDDPVARGRHLVAVGACNDCHTPFSKMGEKGPKPDMSLMLSGHPESFPIKKVPALPEPWMWAGTGTNTAFAGPWGVSFAANLTPDEKTGIGAWTEDWFIGSMRTGKHWGQGREILPPMPWPAYAHFNDDDLKAIFTYLKSIPPVKNAVPLPLPPAGAPAGAAASTGK